MALTTKLTIVDDISTGTLLRVTVNGNAAIKNNIIVGINVLNESTSPKENYFITKTISNPGIDDNWTIPATDFDFVLEGFPKIEDLTITAVAQYIY